MYSGHALVVVEVLILVFTPDVKRISGFHFKILHILRFLFFITVMFVVSIVAGLFASFLLQRISGEVMRRGSTAFTSFLTACCSHLENDSVAQQTSL